MAKCLKFSRVCLLRNRCSSLGFLTMFNQDNYDGSAKGKYAFVRMSLEMIVAP